MKIAAIQMDVKLGEVEHNLGRVAQLAAEAAGQGAQLIVFPECAASGYCFDSLEAARQFAQSVPGPITQQLSDVAADTGSHIVVGMLESSGEQVFNTCVCVGPKSRKGRDGLVGGYRKVHLPYLGVDRFTTPGDRPFSVFQAGDVKLGMLICYDASFPEASRSLMLDAADIIVLPTNWPPGAEQTADFVINARASENKLFFVAANRVGHERGFDFIGKSKICDVHGNTLAMADHRDEAIIYAEIDPQEARVKRIERVAGTHCVDRLADRRPEMYGRLVE